MLAAFVLSCFRALTAAAHGGATWRRPAEPLGEPLPLYGRLQDAGLFDWDPAAGSLLPPPQPGLQAPPAPPLHYFGGGMYASLPEAGAPYGLSSALLMGGGRPLGWLK